MSGTLKGTTISAMTGPETRVVWSRNKDWKMYDKDLFSGQTALGNLVYANLHLCRLKDAVDNGPGDLLIERGVSDPCFYEEISGRFGDWEKIVKTESEILGEGVRKVILIMKDLEFIKTKVLSEPTRAAWFKDPESYLNAQDRYVEFTKTVNHIDEIITIDNALEYIKSLGIPYQE